MKDIPWHVQLKNVVLTESQKLNCVVLSESQKQNCNSALSRKYIETIS